MSAVNDETRFSQAMACLSQNLRAKLSPLVPKLKDNAQEIRLRAGRPLAVVCPHDLYFVTDQKSLTVSAGDNSLFEVTGSDIADTFHNICNYSVYSRQSEISRGFVTIRGGHRAGICGTAVNTDGKLGNIRDISSINIRIAREHRNCAAVLSQKLGDSGGVLICGAPCSGKTTVLRDYARILSTDMRKNVALIDERGELAGTAAGKFQNDIGFCDVYDGYKKSDGMIHALRSMAPDVIVCDEIGSDDDTEAIEHCVNCGVKVVAAVHASNEDELLRKTNIMKLIRIAAFSRIVFLSGRRSAGEVVRICGAGELFVH